MSPLSLALFVPGYYYPPARRGSCPALVLASVGCGQNRPSSSAQSGFGYLLEVSGYQLACRVSTRRSLTGVQPTSRSKSMAALSPLDSTFAEINAVMSVTFVRVTLPSSPMVSSPSTQYPRSCG